MSYAVRKDGKGWRAVESKKDCTADEIWQKDQPDPSAENEILRQIQTLESSISERRKREAILGIEEPEGWLANVNDQIVQLRNQL